MAEADGSKALSRKDLHRFSPASDEADNQSGWNALNLAFPFLRPRMWSQPTSAPETQAVVDAFYASLLRLHNLCLMPDRVWIEARFYEQLTGIAREIEFGKAFLRFDQKDRDESDGRTPEERDEALIRVRKIVEGWMKNLGSGETIYDFQHSPVPRPYTTGFDMIVAGGFIKFGSRKGQHNSSCRAILETVMIGLSAAFETLAADLWEKMVNHRPKSAMDGFQIASGPKQEKTIPLSAFLDYEKNQCGKMLRDNEIVKFASLGAIQQAFIKAFGTSGGVPFERNDIRVLELARNVIAHRGGIIDPQFRKDIRERKYSHPFGELTDAPLRLNGAIAALFVFESLDAASDLIIFSRNWLSSHEI